MIYHKKDIMPLHFYYHNFLHLKVTMDKMNNAFKFIKCYLVVEKDFLDSLPLSQQCTEEEVELLRFLFENKLKKVREPHFYLNSHKVKSR